MLVSQFGFPGATELLVVFLIVFLFLAPLVVLALFLTYRRRDERERVEELESLVETLEARIEELEGEIEEERSRD